MAHSFSLEFFKKFSDSVDLEFERKAMLDRMEEGMAKDWIIALLAENKSLWDSEARAAKALGGTCFNPARY